MGEEQVEQAEKEEREETIEERVGRKLRKVEEAGHCRGRLPNGRRCKAAAMRHRIYCVFHDPEMQKRRLRLAAPIPYEHPEDVQRLLGEVVDAVRRKKLAPRHGNTVGYLATLMMQNQEKVKGAKKSVESAQFYAELAKVMEEAQANRLIWEVEGAQEQQREDEEETE